MNLRFPVALFADELGGYMIELPDFPGHYSEGNDIDHAIDRAWQIIELHLKQNQDGLPEASTLSACQAQPEYAQAAWVILDASAMMPSSTVRTKPPSPWRWYLSLLFGLSLLGWILLDGFMIALHHQEQPAGLFELDGQRYACWPEQDGYRCRAAQAATWHASTPERQ